MLKNVRLRSQNPGEFIEQAIKVLLVDDHPMARGGLHRFLDIEPDINLVGEASNGEEAMEKVVALSPDVILMDVRMPTMNGLEATRLLKDRGRKVIVMSFIDEYLDQAIEAGAYGYLTKDVDGDELVDAIRRVHRGEMVLGRSIMSNPGVGERMMQRLQEMVWGTTDEGPTLALGPNAAVSIADPRGTLDITPATREERDGAEDVRWEGRPPDGTTTILFSDIQDSTALPEKLGDNLAQEIIRAHNDIVREQVSFHEGYEVKTMGDGFMVAFSSARRGLQCSISIQRALSTYNDAHADQPIHVRIGLHTGETIREGDDFYGRNVILAYRIAEQAEGGQILVSSLLKELTESAGDIRFGEEREVALKGLAGLNRLYLVDWS